MRAFDASKSGVGDDPRSRRAGLALPAHPHRLRHACGFALADRGPTPA